MASTVAGCVNCYWRSSGPWFVTVREQSVDVYCATVLLPQLRASAEERIQSDMISRRVKAGPCRRCLYMYQLNFNCCSEYVL